MKCFFQRSWCSSQKEMICRKIDMWRYFSVQLYSGMITGVAASGRRGAGTFWIEVYKQISWRNHLVHWFDAIVAKLVNNKQVVE